MLSELSMFLFFTKILIVNGRINTMKNINTFFLKKKIVPQ